MPGDLATSWTEAISVGRVSLPRLACRAESLHWGVVRWGRGALTWATYCMLNVVVLDRSHVNSTMCEKLTGCRERSVSSAPGHLCPGLPIYPQTHTQH